MVVLESKNHWCYKFEHSSQTIYIINQQNCTPKKTLLHRVYIFMHTILIGINNKNFEIY